MFYGYYEALSDCVLFWCRFWRILQVSRQPDCLSSPNSSQMCLVGNVGVASCRRTPPNDMSSADMETCRENVGNVGPTCRQIMSSSPCQTTWHVVSGRHQPTCRLTLLDIKKMSRHQRHADMSATCRQHVGIFLLDIKKISCSQDMSWHVIYCWEATIFL